VGLAEERDDTIQGRSNTHRRAKSHLQMEGALSIQELELYSSTSNKPIAWFDASKRSVNPQGSSFPPVWSQAQLFLDGPAVAIKDLVVISFLFLLKHQRLDDVNLNDAVSKAAMGDQGMPP